jgi:hypothetical protein
MPREVVEPTKDEEGWERHPAWGMIGASRIQAGPPGTVLFDSEIRHQHYVTVKLETAPGNASSTATGCTPRSRSSRSP